MEEWGRCPRLTMAFSCGVPVVEGWEFPSVRPGGKRQRISFPGLPRMPGPAGLAVIHSLVLAHI